MQDPPARTFSAGRVLAVIGLLFAAHFLAGVVVCAASAQCRNRIPTLANMLEFPLAQPYAILMLGFMVALHCVLCWCLYYYTERRAPRWSSAQIMCMMMLYLSAFVTVMVLPATGWRRNWSDVVPLVVAAAWMVVACISLQANADGRDKGVRILLACALVYVVCVIIHVVLRAVPLDVLRSKGRDVGMLVVQWIGGAVVVVFTILCAARVRHMQMSVVKEH